MAILLVYICVNVWVYVRVLCVCMYILGKSHVLDQRPLFLPHSKCGRSDLIKAHNNSYLHVCVCLWFLSYLLGWRRFFRPTMERSEY